jgi:hypothetical protein
MVAHHTPKVKVYGSCLLSCFHTFRMSWETDTQSSTYVTTSAAHRFYVKILVPVCCAKKCQYYTTKSDTTYSLNYSNIFFILIEKRTCAIQSALPYINHSPFKKRVSQVTLVSQVSKCTVPCPTVFCNIPAIGLPSYSTQRLLSWSWSVGQQSHVSLIN